MANPCAFSAGVLWVDYASGPTIFHLAWLSLVIVVAAWYDGFVIALALAISLPLVRLGFELHWQNVPWSQTDSYINYGIRAIAMGALAVLVGIISNLVREVRVLRGLLPLCMYCHSIRTADGTWKKLEAYLMENSEAILSHGICPECDRPRRSR